METNTFKFRDLVEWTSSAGGSTTTKRGRVVGIQREGSSTFRVENSNKRLSFSGSRWNEFLRRHNAVDQSGMYGSKFKEDRYVVLISIPGDHKNKLYRPRTSQLELMQPSSTVSWTTTIDGTMLTLEARYTLTVWQTTGDTDVVFIPVFHEEHVKTFVELFGFKPQDERSDISTFSQVRSMKQALERLVKKVEMWVLSIPKTEERYKLENGLES